MLLQQCQTLLLTGARQKIYVVKADLGKKQKAMKQKVTEHQLSRDARGQSGTEAEHSLVGQPTSQFQAACRSHMTRSDFFEKLKNPDFYVKSFRF